VTLDRFNQAVDAGDGTETANQFAILSSQISTIKKSLALAGGYAKTQPAAAALSQALDDYLVAVQDYGSDPNDQTQTTMLARGNRVVVLSQELNGVRANNPELNLHCP
jgi:hypothetical protein